MKHEDSKISVVAVSETRTHWEHENILGTRVEAPSSRSTSRRSKLHPVEDRRPPSIDRTVEDPKRLRSASISILKAPLPLPQSTEFTGEVWAPITHGQSDTPHRNTGALFHAQPLVLCAVRHGRLVSSVCSAHNAYIFIRVQRAPFALRAACASQPVSFC
ncbi:hypothetical protein CsSME_00031834 [Camellia sinensis var. sinensis]